MLERISVEVNDRCAKACWFCYNRSSPEGAEAWEPHELVGFLRDCAANGIRAVSLGGGEPLEYEALFDVLAELRGLLFCSITTNGLLLSDKIISRLVSVGIDKVHVSIHFPGKQEAQDAIRQVARLDEAGIRSGVNLLIARGALTAARSTAEAIRRAGIGNHRIIYLPMRGQPLETPAASEVAEVAGGSAFQSTSCLGGCGRSERFCSVAVDKSVGWCSYTSERRRLGTLTYSGLVAAIHGLGLAICGGTNVSAA